MSIRRRPAWGLVASFAAFAISALSPPPASATPVWADQNYRYRRQTTISNYANAAVNLNDVLTFTFTPNFGEFDGKTTTDGSDVRIFHQPTDTTATNVPQVLLPMGSGSTKLLFSAAAPIPVGVPFAFTRSAGASSTFSAAGDSLLLRDDDRTTIATLPFDFPYQGTNHRQVLVSTNGWLTFNLTVVDGHYAGFNAKYIEQGSDFIGPFATDLDTRTNDGGDVFQDTSVTDQVTFRWKASKFTSGTLGDSTMNFSATLYRNGDIRFKYGSPCIVNETHESTRFVDVGLGQGSTRIDLLDQYPVEKLPRTSDPPNTAALDFSNHADIVFTAVSQNVAQDANYYVYYNNPLDDGHGTRALPDPSKLKFYNFDDDSTAGWVAANTDANDVSVPAGSGTLIMQSPLSKSGAHPAAVAASMDDVSDQTVYARIRGLGSNQHQVGIMARANTAGAGYTLTINGWKDLNAHNSNETPGVFAGLGVRAEALRSEDLGTSFTPDYTTPDDTVIGTYDDAGARFRPGAAWSYTVMELKGVGAATKLHGKVFADNAGEPSGYLYEFVGDNTNTIPHYSTGKLGLSGYGGGGTVADVQELDWVYDVLNPFAERMGYGAAAEEEQPVPPGKGTLKGTVSDANSSASVGYIVPLAGASVHIVGQSNGLDILVVTNSVGQYNIYAAPDIYTISVGASGYTSSIKGGNSLVNGGTTVVDFPLSPPNLLPNPDFETVDPTAPGVKPRGWWRKNYEYSNVPVEPNPTAITRPEWLYAISGSDTSAGGKTVTAAPDGGTHFIGIDGSLAFDTSVVPPLSYAVGNIAAWQPESSTASPVYTDSSDPADSTHRPFTNPDGRGQGPHAPIVSGQFYFVSAWINHPYGPFTDTGQGLTYNPLARIRIRPLAFDNESDNVGGGQNIIGNGFTITQSAQTDQAVNNGWVKVSTIIQAPGGSHFLSVRCYGVDVPPGQPVYFDNLSVQRITPPLFSGTVKDSSGNPVAGSYVGIAEANRGTQPGAGMANPIVNGYTFTDANGRWGVRFVPTSGVSYVAQSYLDLFVDDHGNKASAVFPVPTPPAQTAITYDPAVEANIAANRPVVSYSSQTATDPLEPNSGPAFHACDGSIYWWNSDSSASNPGAGTKSKYQWVVVDLGQSIDWSKIDQVTIESRQPADHYQLRVSDTPPPASAPWADQASYTAASNVAKAWGTLAYDSPTGAGRRAANTYLNCITRPALKTTGLTGQYFMFLADTLLAPYAEFKIYEIRIEVPTATLVGRVVDGTGHGVAKASVGINPDGPVSLYATTDNAGNYTLNNVPTATSISITAHKVTSGSTVFAVSNTAGITPVAGKITPVRDISLGSPVPNAVGATATASIDNSLLENANPAITPGLTVDQNFSTLWESSVISSVPGPGLPIVDVNSPLNLIVDMGTSKFINTVVITWTKELAPFYSVDLSTDNITYKNVYTTVAATGGYPYLLNGQALDGVDAITFSPTSARYIRIQMSAHSQDRLAIREIQAALAVPPVLPPDRLGAINVLKIAGGLIEGPLLTDPDFAALDANADGSITLRDAVKIWRRSNGLN